MTLYKVTAREIYLPSGIIRLTAGQAHDRAHNLKKTKDTAPNDNRSAYQILAPIGFKKGEILWFDGQINKSMAKDLDPLAVKDDSQKD